MNDITAVWILGFGMIWYFLLRKEDQLWRFIGSIFLFINGIIGILISDHIITSFIMFITLIIMVKISIDTIEIATK